MEKFDTKFLNDVATPGDKPESINMTVAGLSTLECIETADALLQQDLDSSDVEPGVVSRCQSLLSTVRERAKLLHLAMSNSSSLNSSDQKTIASESLESILCLQR